MLLHPFRRFGSAPTFAVTVITTLGLTIGLVTTVSSVLDAVFIRPLPYHEVDRIFALRTISPQGYTQPASFPEYLDWRRDSASFASTAGYLPFGNANVETGDSAISLHSVSVTDNFFDVLGVKPILGRTFEKGEEDAGRNAVTVLSNEVWRNYFGARRDVIGSKIKLDGRPYTIVGVMPAGFRFPISRSDAIYYPVNPKPQDRNQRGNHWLSTLCKLAPGIARVEAQARFNQVFTRLGEQYPASKNRRVSLIDLATFTVGNSDGALRLLLYAVLALLAVGCVNLAGLLIARGITREHEIAIRNALGASRRRIVAHLLWENVVYAIAGGVLGIALAYGLLRATSVLIVASLNRGAEVEINGTILAISLMIAILTSLIAGVWPALRLSTISGGTSLRAGNRGGMDRGQSRLRAAFVTAQVALALVLLVTAGLVFRALERYQHADFGFDPAHILAAEIDLSPGSYESRDIMADFYRPLLDRVHSMHGVRAAGLIQIIPIENWGWNSDIQIVGQPPPPPNQERLAEVRFVTPGYYSALGLRLIHGRLFDDKLDTPDLKNATIVVNEKFVDRFIPKGVDPIGQAIDQGGGSKSVIVGVVSNVRQSILEGDLAEFDYALSELSPQSQPQFISSMQMVVRTDGEPASITPDLRRILGDLDRTLPFRTPKTMSAVIATALTFERLENWLFASFAMLALALSLIGLYGLISQEVELSRREIGIRIAVGATRARIFAAIYRRVGGMLAGGIAVGLLGTWAARTLIAAVEPIKANRDAALLAGLVLMIALVSLAAAFIPARRAATTDPMNSLRAE